ncbi:hypothetical protein ILUMI_11541 [Ignelater luminosus]|uniref:PiggyBac transposable element-derived protein domain-containing protein n=1 Tax=Ignelater luminosus TaxID=2038154 RepID=A0A8K0GDV1_IGNLU|nr:hypothetical protein ILUMI_11541 [Ignelater luminosus]
MHQKWDNKIKATWNLIKGITENTNFDAFEPDTVKIRILLVLGFATRISNFYKKALSLKEIEEILEDDSFYDDLKNSNYVDIVIIPPDVHELSDEEQFDDDVGLNDASSVDDVVGTLEIRVISKEPNISTNVASTSKKNELNSFLDILLLSGYKALPSERMYWSNNNDLGCPVVKATMSKIATERSVLLDAAIDVSKWPLIMMPYHHWPLCRHTVEKKRRKISVSQLAVIKTYNKSMGDQEIGEENYPEKSLQKSTKWQYRALQCQTGYTTLVKRNSLKTRIREH